MSVLTTADVPAPRQYDHWRDAVRATHAAFDMPARRQGAFRGHVAQRSLGAAEVLACVCDPCSGQRAAPEIARSDRAWIGVLFLLQGAENLGHADARLRLEAGQFTVWSTARPLSFAVPDRLRKVTLLLPAELARGLPGENHLERAYDARSGCGALLLAQLVALAGLEQPLCDAGQQAALGSMLGLLGAAVGASISPSPASQRLHQRATAYIRAHLAEPSLSPDGMAAALGVSRRGLDRCFAEAGCTVHRSIWSERLERCRADLLLDPRERISAIAFRWGFNDAAHFSRAFRSAFGETPSRYRAARL